MTESLTVMMAQINPIVGAIEANTNTIIDIVRAQASKNDLIVFPELVLTGYPPEDLLFRNSCANRVNTAINAIMAATGAVYVIVGHPSWYKNQCFNSASVFYSGKCVARYYKQTLPTHGVFDERRYFTPGPETACVFKIKNTGIGLCICEDLWQPGPVERLKSAGAQLLISLNASPFEETKQQQRMSILKEHALTGLNIVYVNLVGGQDELLFDGQSMAYDNHGQCFARAPAFESNLQTVTFNPNKARVAPVPDIDHTAILYRALVFGLHDYIEKNGFPAVLIGLSGGIDSALTLAIAADALGAERVHAVMMPSRYTATISHEYALQQLNTMHVAYTTLDIEPTFNALISTLEPSFIGHAPDVTEENLQARIRGTLLMALSNKTGNMVLTTSNKSELAVGYSTLYGDMCGGFSVLKDVFKTQVYALAKYRNTITPVIPEQVLTRAPSAELAWNQTDQDSLPEYEILDTILRAYIYEHCDLDDLLLRGYTRDLVEPIIQRIKRNEHKRRQAAPGVKISHCAFGKDWRYPITSKF